MKKYLAAGILMELIGNGSPEAWRKREALEKKYPKKVIASLAGVSSKRSRRYLKERLGKDGKQKFWWAICRGLIGDASPEAEEMREWLRFDKDVGRLRAGRNARLIRFLGLYKSEWWYRFRKKIDKWFPPGLYLPGDLLVSTIGVVSIQKYRLINELAELCPAEAIICLAGDYSPAATRIQERYRGDRKLGWAFRRSLEPDLMNVIKMELL
jgi:hypothetical protein